MFAFRTSPGGPCPLGPLPSATQPVWSGAVVVVVGTGSCVGAVVVVLVVDVGTGVSEGIGPGIGAGDTRRSGDQADPSGQFAVLRTVVTVTMTRPPVVFASTPGGNGSGGPEPGLGTEVLPDGRAAAAKAVDCAAPSAATAPA